MSFSRRGSIHGTAGARLLSTIACPVEGRLHPWNGAAGPASLLHQHGGGLVLVDLVVTFAIAAMVSLVFARLLGWSGRNRTEFSTAVLFLFIIIWIGSWTLGRWIVPIEPTFGGAPLLTFTFLAFLIGFIIAAAATAPPRPIAPPTAGPPPARPANVAFFGLFFWVAMAMLALALVARYAVAR